MISKQKPTPGVHLQKKQAYQTVNSAPVNNSCQNESVSGACSAELWRQTVMQTS